MGDFCRESWQLICFFSPSPSRNQTDWHALTYLKPTNKFHIKTSTSLVWFKLFSLVRERRVCAEISGGFVILVLQLSDSPGLFDVECRAKWVTENSWAIVWENDSSLNYIITHWIHEPYPRSYSQIYKVWWSCDLWSLCVRYRAVLAPVGTGSPGTCARDAESRRTPGRLDGGPIAQCPSHAHPDIW